MEGQNEMCDLTRGRCKLVQISSTHLCQIAVKDICELSQELDGELEGVLSLKDLLLRGLIGSQELVAYDLSAY